MARRTLPGLTSVAPGREPYTLHTQWRDGREAVVNVATVVCASLEYAKVFADADQFRHVTVGADARRAIWPGGVEMPASTLWRLAQEQSGHTMSASEFRRWRSGRGLTLDGAARALGLSRRMIAYYEQGSKSIPRVVSLATQALDQIETHETAGQA